jgi:hypothetical protein
MCDTFVALGNSTLDGRTIFAKNSNREPNEPQYVFFYPRMECDSKELYTTSQKIKQVEKTYAVLISKPSWMWGGEMGVNENGVAIGNEAIFTREMVSRQGLLGMDILRIALERSESAEQAVTVITDLIQRYGQGESAGYTKAIFYHNSYIVADRENAWVLETSDRYWTAERVKDCASISNCLTIAGTGELQHPETVGNALEKGWCKRAEDFGFKKCYEKKFFSWLSGGEARRRRTMNLVGEKDLDLKKTFEILRDHGGSRLFGSMKNICMHAGTGLVSSQTTGSMVVVLGEKIEVWLTNTSAPCLSFYKPVWFDSDSSTLPFEKEADALNHWGNWEVFHRMAVTRYEKARQLWEQYCLPFEEELILHKDSLEHRDITAQAFDTGWKIAKKMASLLQGSPIEAGFFNKRYWEKKNRELQELKAKNFKRPGFV